jgi:hypothetical protein
LPNILYPIECIDYKKDFILWWKQLEENHKIMWECFIVLDIMRNYKFC